MSNLIEMKKPREKPTGEARKTSKLSQELSLPGASRRENSLIALEFLRYTLSTKRKPSDGGKMESIKIFTKANCPKCPGAKEIAKELKKEGMPVLHYDLDTIDGLAEASYHSILSTPSILIEDEEEKEVICWRGEIPTVQEVKQYLLRNS
jgi:hypothetical protein